MLLGFHYKQWRQGLVSSRPKALDTIKSNKQKEKTRLKYWNKDEKDVMESSSVLMLRINQFYNSQKWEGFSSCSLASLF